MSLRKLRLTILETLRVVLLEARTEHLLISLNIASPAEVLITTTQLWQSLVRRLRAVVNQPVPSRVGRGDRILVLEVDVGNIKRVNRLELARDGRVELVHVGLVRSVE